MSVVSVTNKRYDPSITLVCITANKWPCLTFWLMSSTEWFLPSTSYLAFYKVSSAQFCRRPEARSCPTFIHREWHNLIFQRLSLPPLGEGAGQPFYCPLLPPPSNGAQKAESLRLFIHLLVPQLAHRSNTCHLLAGVDVMGLRWKSCSIENLTPIKR